MSRRSIFALTSAGLTVFALLTLNDTPHLHSDLDYLLFFIVFMLAGLIGALTVRSTVFPFLTLAALWTAIYLVKSIRHGFLEEGFIAHLADLALLAVVTIPVAAIAKLIRNRSGANGRNAT